jgi:colanic acid/amylovoran biosynthesis glycosyltransferase
MNLRAPSGQARPRRVQRGDAGDVASAPAPPGLGVAYIMSRFPKITETFVLYEMKAMEELGARVELFPLLHEPPGPRHAEAAAYEERAHFTPFLSWEVLRANAKRMFGAPVSYFGTWWEMVSGTLRSPKFCAGALVYFPKCVAFADRMEALGVDHVHAHFASHPALAALIVHRLTGIPYSFTAHGSDLHVDRTMLPAKVASASFVVAVSSYNQELIATECGEYARDKVVVIHCGTDSSAFAGRVDNGDQKGDDRAGDRVLRIACVASLEEVKGHRFLVRACHLLTERGVDVHLDLVGDGALRSEVEGLVEELGLGGRVTLHGAVPRPVVGGILAGADVFVLASHPTRSGRREGIPVALMEAMMSELPVVASALSGIPELVDDGRTGYLVPSGDPEALADRLERFVGDPELRRAFGRAGRAKVEAEFDILQGARNLLGEMARHR